MMMTMMYILSFRRKDGHSNSKRLDNLSHNDSRMWREQSHRTIHQYVDRYQQLLQYKRSSIYQQLDATQCADATPIQYIVTASNVITCQCHESIARA